MKIKCIITVFKLCKFENFIMIFFYVFEFIIFIFIIIRISNGG